MNSWIWFMVVVLAFWGLQETIRRGFDSVARQQREMNRNLIRIAQQLGDEVENDPLHDEVWELIQAGRKIEAIKLVRSRLKLPLKEAKIYVDEIESASWSRHRIR